MSTQTPDNSPVCYYNAATTAWKGVWTYLAAVGVVGASDVAAIGWPATWDELQSRWPTLLIALIPAVWRVLENYRKNSSPHGPLWDWTTGRGKQ